MPNILDTEIQYLPGIGPKRADLLAKEVEIHTFRDLLYFFPFRWIDKSKIYSIAEVNPESAYVQIRGVIVKTAMAGGGRKKRFVATLQDATGSIDLVFFSGLKWITDKIKENSEFIVFGKVSEFNGALNMVHPEVTPPSQAYSYGTGSMVGIYSTTEKMKSAGLGIKVITKFESTLLEKVLPAIHETLPEDLLQRKGLCSLQFALKNIHFPHNGDSLLKAQNRLKFEELFYLQLSLLKQKNVRMSHEGGLPMPKVGDNFNKCYNALPYPLTGAQKRVIKEMRADMMSGKQMNRLLQGDVGSGKTLVAVLLALIAVDNGCQACIMAPTEVLANQHLASITKFLEPTSATVALLTGSTKAKERKQILEDLATGKINIIVGTHALIEDRVQFRNLGFAVIDEQHRFGVDQRSRLWNKGTTLKSDKPANISKPANAGQPTGSAALFPHILVMTATPIPRTLAMTLYGDLDVSVLDELPPGRKPVQTMHAWENQRPKIYAFMKQQIKAGRQIFIVYPLIKESEKIDYENLEAGYQSIIQEFKAPEYITAVVHGQQKTADKDFDMQLFAQGKANILVATSVIEVGVDVPNATVMVIESSERFGLSQLHQLRGRVGRGSEKSYCILMSGYKLSHESRKRLELMCSTTDGFKLAEEDMKMRGPGDLEGTTQSGLAIDLHIASLYQDGRILENARQTALKILSSDPLLQSPANQLLTHQIAVLRHQGKDATDYSQIS
ncbi:MAG TPA: ATP-dependent DNA helicase RecG [Candidatus Egerieousia sp.]|nr:ATP-dependent DNA helicase RecG [Candidatus Egerieousia sp.]HPT06123.1 ATP-dependent DNA helicase RecG [Candidatus Egerieousia sp.]